MQDPLKDLAQLTDALYQVELAKMSALNAQEARLRQQLAELEERRLSSQTLPDAQMTGLRQIGADVLWHGWVSRARQDLNVQLAQVLAQKARMTTALRRAFGKQLAASEMLDAARNEARQDRAKRAQQAQDDMQLMNAERN